MRILLLQRYELREPRTPIALMDLAAYGRMCNHQMTVAYSDHAIEHYFLGQFDAIGFSSIGLNSGDQAELIRLRNRFDGPIMLGGKCADTITELPEPVGNLELGLWHGPGETWLATGEYDPTTYPPWAEVDFRALDRMEYMTEAMSSRGCPYRCHFCHNTEPRMRFFSVERTVQNAKLLLQIIGRHRVFFVDDVFAVNAARMWKLLAAADAAGVELRGKTAFFVHVNHINKATVAAISAYQPQEVQMGIESGDDGMLESMGKGFDSGKAEDSLRRLHAHGIRVACLFLLGFPGETPDSLANTVSFVQRNRQYMSGWWASYYQPVPNTVGWARAKERLGHEPTGEWNTMVSYVDPNLTESDLVSARKAIME